MSKELLKISDLTIQIAESSKTLVNKVGFSIAENEIFGLVGGSGSGKTTTGLAILNLLSLGLHVSSGVIEFQGNNLLSMNASQLRTIRGGKISMVFQEPLYAFNPVFTIGYQIEEVLQTHCPMQKSLVKDHVLELLRMAGLKDPQRVFGSYPHQLSGGMRQRAMIAQAIAGKPKLIIADEPTSNLDVTLQARIMELFRQLQREMSLSILLISHDLGMISHLADKIAVMTSGSIVEQGDVQHVFHEPKHEYTQKLVRAAK